MIISLIWAQAQNRVIGRNNKLPWHLSEDLKYFKRVTMGRPVIMGRKTFESIGRPLPGRTNIIITRNKSYHSDNVKVVHTLEEAISLCESINIIDDCDEAMVIGGAEIYKQAFAFADRLYLTEVHADVDGDAYFPEFDREQWSEVGREDYAAAGPNPYDYSFLILEKK